MERTNTFIVESNPALWELAENCARLYNEVNFERRQAYIRYKRFDWYPKHLYEKYAPLIASATAQQIINKNNEAWRSFFKLKRLEAQTSSEGSSLSSSSYRPCGRTATMFQR